MNKYFFSPLSDFTMKGIEILYSILDEIVPMNRVRTLDLPSACRDLSEYLTSNRSSLRQSYWRSPRLTSAYLRYFLPWNLLRLCSLLPNLPIHSITENSSLLDIGSGPLTFPIALFFSREDLRSMPLTLTACDADKHILHLGRTVFERLREELFPHCPWTIHTLRSSIENIAQLYRNTEQSPLRLISLCNVLNEREEKNNSTGIRSPAVFRSMAKRFHAMLASDGMLFTMEPGTRLGGNIIQHLRDSALGGISLNFLLDSCPDNDEILPDDFDENDTLPPLFLPISPCTHLKGCPLAYKKNAAWCHFNTPVLKSPQKLQEISIAAGLNKESLSLSFMLMKKTANLPRRPLSNGKNIHARIISDAFSVPGLSGVSRYACSEKGLCLIPSSLHFPSGSICEGHYTGEKDSKSHAYILQLHGNTTSYHTNMKHYQRKKIKEKQYASDQKKKNVSEKFIHQNKKQKSKDR